jgi:hypothetical protein
LIAAAITPKGVGRDECDGSAVQQHRHAVALRPLAAGMQSGPLRSVAEGVVLENGEGQTQGGWGAKATTRCPGSFRVSSSWSSRRVWRAHQQRAAILARMLRAGSRANGALMKLVDGGVAVGLHRQLPAAGVGAGGQIAATVSSLAAGVAGKGACACPAVVADKAG